MGFVFAYDPLINSQSLIHKASLPDGTPCAGLNLGPARQQEAKYIFFQ